MNLNKFYRPTILDLGVSAKIKDSTAALLSWNKIISMGWWTQQADKIKFQLQGNLLKLGGTYQNIYTNNKSIQCDQISE